MQKIIDPSSDPTSPPPTSPAPLPPTPGGTPKAPWYKRKAVIILATVIVVVLLVLFAHGHAPDAALHPKG